MYKWALETGTLLCTRTHAFHCAGAPAEIRRADVLLRRVWYRRTPLRFREPPRGDLGPREGLSVRRTRVQP